MKKLISSAGAVDSGGWKCLWVCFGLLLSTSAKSLEFQSFAFAESRYSNNAGSLKVLRRDDVRNTLGLDSQLTEQRENLEADLRLSIESDRYVRDTSSVRTSVTSGLGLLNVNLVEEFLDWETSFNRVQVLQDALQEDEQSNSNYRNSLFSGPVITTELSDTLLMEGTVQYVNIENSEEAMSDSERANSGISLLHHYNQLTVFNLSTQYQTMLNEDELDPYDLRVASIGITRQMVRGSLSANIGRSSLIPEAGDPVNSNFYEFGFSHDEFLGHALHLGYTQDISDTSVGFQDELLPEEDTGQLPDNDFVTRKRWSGSVGRDMGVHSYTISAARSDSRYGLTNGHTLMNSGSLRYERMFLAHLTGGASVSILHREYLNNPLEGVEKTRVYTVDSAYQFSELLSAGSYFRFISRNNRQDSASVYEEIQIGLTVRYQVY